VAPASLKVAPALVFDAALLNAPGVSARVAVAAHQQLTALHDAIQQAFGWQDDHLYSFWLDGNFWGAEAAHLVRPGTPDIASRTADVRLAELGIRRDAPIAYVFDYGDEWRVRVSVSAETETDDGTYPRVLERRGTPPPQYPSLDEK
jgi:Plasmid pRiA4b ORF-3-like protein